MKNGLSNFSWRSTKLFPIMLSLAKSSASFEGMRQAAPGTPPGATATASSERTTQRASSTQEAATLGSAGPYAPGVPQSHRADLVPGGAGAPVQSTFASTRSGNTPVCLIAMRCGPHSRSGAWGSQPSHSAP